MQILPYSTAHRAQCLAAFDSNVGQYFAPSEREEFIEYLDSLTAEPEYFVCLKNDQLVACGGIGIHAETGSLAWGLVHRDFHGQGIGTLLTDYRLSCLKANSSVQVVKIETSQHTEGFYNKRGFVATKSVANGFGAGIDCVSMALSFAR
ncbi:GNAT family N-acetyltransferase [uncultured Ferrimonas sp.]|uniref:GNAT family N-acetyltransferase n=1 Tax=uncultured Ferrimonas sp. TaxID=432640 RepID=UPI00263282D6|nr:GNAT family N-acetyltransferase [uncultured Ferrimonas sp.]